uniref:C-type lectin domain-containing protein n=1 Tax=Ciona savignyi TaxID=51511 RepID=H2YKL8_CIOSA
MRNAETRRLMFNQNFLTRGENYWIGMNDIVNEGTLVWIDGVAQNSSNSNFAPGEPNDIGYIGANADCVRLFSSAVALLMDDIECSRNVFALCEKN